MTNLKVWTSTKFSAHYSGAVGAAAIVVAYNAVDAIELLEAELEKAGLPQKIDFDQIEEVLPVPGAIILHDGEY